MSRWFRIYHDMLDDPAVQRLPPDEAKAAFIGALRGEQTVCSRWIRPGSDRLPPSEWVPIRQRIFARDDFTCTYCGERGGQLECDHIHPLSRGGSNDDDNLTTACRPCNRAKRDKTLDEWSGPQ